MVWAAAAVGPSFDRTIFGALGSRIVLGASLARGVRNLAATTNIFLESFVLMERLIQMGYGDLSWLHGNGLNSTTQERRLRYWIIRRIEVGRPTATTDKMGHKTK